MFLCIMCFMIKYSVLSPPPNGNLVLFPQCVFPLLVALGAGSLNSTRSLEKFKVCFRGLIFIRNCITPLGGSRDGAPVAFGKLCKDARSLQPGFCARGLVGSSPSAHPQA